MLQKHKSSGDREPPHVSLTVFQNYLCFEHRLCLLSSSNKPGASDADDWREKTIPGKAAQALNW